MTWRVMEMQRAIGLFKGKKTICPDCEQKLALALVGVRLREWNCSCSNCVMRTLALRDSLTLKGEN